MVKAKDVVLTLGAIGAIIAYALFARRPPEPPPGESGGQVTIRLEMPAQGGFYGSPALPLDVTYTVSGTATGGSQPINMALGAEIFSTTLNTWVSAPGTAFTNVPLNTPQTLRRTLTPADLETLTGRSSGTFRIKATMTLINILGAFGFESGEATFDIAVPPTGTVGVGVT